jgi:hypothetical protein
MMVHNQSQQMGRMQMPMAPQRAAPGAKPQGFGAFLGGPQTPAAQQHQKVAPPGGPGGAGGAGAVQSPLSMLAASMGPQGQQSPMQLQSGGGNHQPDGGIGYAPATGATAAMQNMQTPTVYDVNPQLDHDRAFGGDYNQAMSMPMAPPDLGNLTEPGKNPNLTAGIDPHEQPPFVNTGVGLDVGNDPYRDMGLVAEEGANPNLTGGIDARSFNMNPSDKTLAGGPAQNTAGNPQGAFTPIPKNDPSRPDGGVSTDADYLGDDGIMHEGTNSDSDGGGAQGQDWESGGVDTGGTNGGDGTGAGQPASGDQSNGGNEQWLKDFFAKMGWGDPTKGPGNGNGPNMDPMSMLRQLADGTGTGIGSLLAGAGGGIAHEVNAKNKGEQADYMNNWEDLDSTKAEGEKWLGGQYGKEADDAARQMMTSDVNKNRDQALRSLVAQQNRGGTVGSGSEQGAWGDANNALTQGNLQLAKDSFGRRLQGAQQGSDMVQSRAKYIYDQMNEGLMSAQDGMAALTEIFGHITDMAPDSLIKLPGA